MLRCFVCVNHFCLDVWARFSSFKNKRQLVQIASLIFFCSGVLLVFSWILSQQHKGHQNVPWTKMAFFALQAPSCYHKPKSNPKKRKSKKNIQMQKHLLFDKTMWSFDKFSLFHVMVSFQKLTEIFDAQQWYCSTWSTEQNQQDSLGIFRNHINCHASRKLQTTFPFFVGAFTLFAFAVWFCWI